MKLPKMGIEFVWLTSIFFHSSNGIFGKEIPLEHMLTTQQNQPEDYVSTKWSIFDVFRNNNEPTTQASSKKSLNFRKRPRSNVFDSERPQKSWKESTSKTTSQVNQLARSKSAVASGGLLPTKIFVLNLDKLFDRWLKFRSRWTLVNGPGNFSVQDSLNPIRFRGADLAADKDKEGSPKLALSWKRKLDNLPPRTRKAAIECRDKAVARGEEEAMAYGLSHLALWESVALDRRLKSEDRVLILDDSARPRQHWKQELEHVALSVPKNWDIISLGWWGDARTVDVVGDGNLFKVNPPFHENGNYYYGGAHARLFRVRVIKKLLVSLSKAAKPPQCDLLWPDADAIVWANSTGVNYFALRQPMFGLVGDSLDQLPEYERWAQHAVDGPVAQGVVYGSGTRKSSGQLRDPRIDPSKRAIEMIRARLPANIKCRTIVNRDGIERDICQ